MASGLRGCAQVCESDSVESLANPEQAADSYASVRRRGRKVALRSRVVVADFFSGCGGTSAGLRQAGMEIAVGIDIDPDAAQTFRLNFPEADFIQADVRSIATDDLASPLRRRGWGEPDTFLLFSACAPCQPFSRQRRGRNDNDDRMPLLADLVRFVDRYLPDFIFLENVPGLQTLGPNVGPFAGFVDILETPWRSISWAISSATPVYSS